MISLFLYRFPFTLLFLFRCCFRFRFRFLFPFPFLFLIPVSGFSRRPSVILAFGFHKKLACCLMKPIKVFVPFRFKTRNVSNAAKLFRFLRGKSKKFHQVYLNYIKIFGSNIGKLCFLLVILNLKINFQKVNKCGMKYNVTAF